MVNVIYGLIDPNTKELRYIGYSSDLERRIKDHHRSIYLKVKSHKNYWIKSLLAQGQKAEVIIIEEYDSVEQLPQAEIEMVEYYRWVGASLTNGTRGGDGHRKGDKLSEETKKKLSDRFSGINHPMYGKTHTEESRRKISESKTGVPWGHHSDETKKKMSITKIGKTFSEEHKSKLAQAKIGLRGAKRSLETKQKMSASQKGKTKLTEEQIELIKSDNRSYIIIASEYGVHFKTIANYKKNKKADFISIN